MAIRRLSTTSMFVGSKTNKFWDQATSLAAFESIYSYTITSNTPSITFGNIPSDYEHLQIRGYVFEDNDKLVRIRFNGDTGSNYTQNSITTDNTTVSGGSSTSLTGWDWFYNYRLTGYLSSSPTNFIINILNYKDTNKFKTVRAYGAIDYQGSAAKMFLHNGMWRSTSAITSISLAAEGASNFKNNSHIALYGIKG